MTMFSVKYVVFSIIIASFCCLSLPHTIDTCVFDVENVCTSCPASISLLEIQDFLEGSNSSKELNFVICSERLVLESLISFKNMASITIQSYRNLSTVIACNGSNMGFKFTHSSSITLKNLQIANCGVEYEVTSRSIKRDATTDTPPQFQAGVYIFNCSRVTIMNVSIYESDGIGLSIINTYGEVVIENSTFQKNSIKKHDGVVSGGGGLYIEYSCCSLGECYSSSCNILAPKSNYTIRNCTFEENAATTAHSKELPTSYHTASGKLHQDFGNGGGMSVVFSDHTEIETELTVINCTFGENSAALGGGLFILMQGSSPSTLHVERSFFDRNSAKQFGGGLCIILESQWNEISFHKCNVTGNNATVGGGTAILFSASSANLTVLESKINFDGCMWRGNIANFGAALSVANDNPLAEYPNCHLPSPKFLNCLFESNTVAVSGTDTSLHRNLKTEGKGTFIAFGIVVEFEGETTFDKNMDTGLLLDSSTAVFSRNSLVSLKNNIGIMGGAILVLGTSSIEINDNSIFNFSENEAHEKGGGICQLSFGTSDFVTPKPCLYHYHGTKNLTDRNISFVFQNNRVGLRDKHNADSNLGHSIYASNLHSCFMDCEHEDFTETPRDCIANFTFEDRYENDISSSENTLILNSSITEEMSVIPGQHIYFSADLKDTFNNTVVALYHVNVLGNNISTTTRYTSDKWIQIFGYPGKTATIRVETVGTLWKAAFNISVRMTWCPPGYSLENYTVISGDQPNRQFCQCSLHTKSQRIGGIVSCDTLLFKASLKVGYWIGYLQPVNSSLGDNQSIVLISGYCPIGYCITNNSSSREIWLPNSTDPDELDWIVCGRRTGRFCARCRGNLTTHYHIDRFQCKSSESCKIGWILVIVSEFIPITVFFFIIIIFNVNFTGIINGLIFFFQITDVSVHIVSNFVNCPQTVTEFLNVYSLLISIFNLKFFYHHSLSFCLWKGAQTLDLLLFRYLKIVYSIVLVFVILLVQSACSRRINRCLPRHLDVKSTIIHGISGFLVICYSECTKISLLLLVPVEVSGQDMTVVLYNGELEHFKGTHLAYAIPAVVFLIVVGLGPVLLLISYPLCYKIFSLLGINESKFVRILCMVIPLEKFKPFYDSFQSSFKDEYRFCSGLYFAYRLIILVTFLATRNLTDFYVAILIEFTVILCLHATLQPYKKKLHNNLDSFVFANFLIITVVTFYSYRRAWEWKYKSSAVTTSCALITVLHYIPVGIFAVICVVEAVSKLRLVKMRKSKVEDTVNNDNFYELSENLLLNRRDSIVGDDNK